MPRHRKTYSFPAIRHFGAWLLFRYAVDLDHYLENLNSNNPAHIEDYSTVEFCRSGVDQYFKVPSNCKRATFEFSFQEDPDAVRIVYPGSLEADCVVEDTHFEPIAGEIDTLLRWIDSGHSMYDPAIVYCDLYLE